MFWNLRFFFDAFAWNSFSSATVTATPIISKNIPINITKNNINTAGNNGKFVIEFVDINENTIDKIKCCDKYSD